MFSIVVMPFILIGIIVIFVSLGLAFHIKDKQVRSGCLALLAVPFLLFILFNIIASFEYRKYVGSYYGKTEADQEVSLTLFGNKTFELQVDDCDLKIKGSWDSVLYDEYILELSSENEFLPSAYISEREVEFRSSIDLNCIQAENLKLYRGE